MEGSYIFLTLDGDIIESCMGKNAAKMIVFLKKLFVDRSCINNNVIVYCTAFELMKELCIIVLYSSSNLVCSQYLSV